MGGQISHSLHLACNNNMYMYLDRRMCHKQDGELLFYYFANYLNFLIIASLSFP